MTEGRPGDPQRPAPAQAVALRYEAGEGAPEVVAKGRGPIAEAIIARAREAGVYVHESPQLVQLLMNVDLDAQIPPALYVAVAELLAWIWRIEHELGGDAPENSPGGLEALRRKS